MSAYTAEHSFFVQAQARQPAQSDSHRTEDAPDEQLTQIHHSLVQLPLDLQDTRTDLVHLIVNLSVIQLTATILAQLGDWLPDALSTFPTTIALWGQLIIVAVILDLSLYCMHRLSHHLPWLWHLHAPHHSAERLYWMNGERRHPLHAAIMAGPGLLILFIMGAPAAVVATWFGILTVHLAFQHANLDYSLGWLRKVIGVAETHRWHHKRDFEDAQVNFGEFLLIWDHLLGSFYDSAGKLTSAEVGLRDEHYPTDYLGQLIEPFTTSGKQGLASRKAGQECGGTSIDSRR